MTYYNSYYYYMIVKLFSERLVKFMQKFTLSLNFILAFIAICVIDSHLFYRLHRTYSLIINVFLNKWKVSAYFLSLTSNESIRVLKRVNT